MVPRRRWFGPLVLKFWPAIHAVRAAFCPKPLVRVLRAGSLASYWRRCTRLDDLKALVQVALRRRLGSGLTHASDTAPGSLLLRRIWSGSFLAPETSTTVHRVLIDAPATLFRAHCYTGDSVPSFEFWSTRRRWSGSTSTFSYPRHRDPDSVLHVPKTAFNRCSIAPLMKIRVRGPWRSSSKENSPSLAPH